MKHIFNMSLLWLIIVLSSIDDLKAQVVCTYTASNDLCANAQVINNIPLSTSTCCGDIEGINLCNLTETGVWYYYPQVMSASLIEITNLSISGAISVEFYSGTCGNLTLISKSDCSGFGFREFEVPNCTGELYIHVSSTENGCGEFTIRATDVVGCDYADNCSDITPAQLLQPVADGAQVCVSSCMNYSCISTCTDASVWFRFDTDDLTTAVSLLINGADFVPQISVFRATNCNDFDDLLVCESVAPGEFIDLQVTPDASYFVELSVESGDPGAFDICVNAIQDYIECSEGVLTVTRTENPGANPYGPYCPGETVMFCYDLDFYVDTPDAGNGCQWLQGIVPILGGGWDLNMNNPESQNPLNWMWFDDVDYNVNSPVLALTTDGGGNSVLEYGPGGLQAGDILPGGWYFVSNGTVGCSNDGHPDNMWGVTTPCGTVFSFSHCFELTAKSVNDIQDCDDAYLKDLSVTIFNFADGETGCYTSLACSGDTPVRFEGQLDCSGLVEIVADGQEICSGDYASIPISIEGGYEIPLQVEVLNAGNTSGAQDWVFETGSGLIPDQIINNGNSIETITYEVTFHDPTTDCNIPTTTFDVLVYPEFSFNIETQHVVCEGETVTMEAPAGHDAYAWYDATTNELLSNALIVSTDTSGYYRLEITEGFCTAAEIIEVVVNPELENALDVTEIYVCNNYIGTDFTAANLNQYILNDIEGIWLDENGLQVDNAFFVDFEGSTPGTLTYTFNTTGALAPCPNYVYDLDIIIQDCQCPEIDVISPPDFCAVSQTFDLTNVTAGSEPGSWSLSDGPSMNFISVNNDMLMVTNNTVAGVYSLQFTLDDPNVAPLCSRDTIVEFNVYAVPEATIEPTATVCNVYSGTLLSVLDLDDLNLSQTGGDWRSDDMNITIDVDNEVSFQDMDPGFYTFYFMTSTAQSPCIDQEYTAVVEVIDCSCPDTSLLPIDDLCLDVAGTIDLSNYRITQEDGDWQLADGPDVGTLVLSNENLSYDQNTEAGSYTLRYVLSDPNIPPLCDTFEEIELNLNRPVEVDLVPAVEVCNEYTGGLETFILVSDILDTDNDGSWSSSSPNVVIGQNGRIEFSMIVPQDITLTYTTTDAQAPCTNASFETVVTVLDCSCPNVNVMPLGDVCRENTDLYLDNLLQTTEPGEWSVVDGPPSHNLDVDQGVLRLRNMTTPGQYTVRYTLSDPDIAPLCDTYTEFQFNVYVPVSAQIEPTVELCNEFTGTLETGFDLDDIIQTNNSGDWTVDDLNVIIASDNTVDFDGTDAGVYTFSYTTNDAEAPCVDMVYQSVVTVNDCRCPEFDLTAIDDTCIEDLTIDLSMQLTGGHAGVWSVEGGPDITSLNISGDQLEVSSSTVEGLYVLRYTLSANDVPPLCDSFKEIDLQLYAAPEANIIPQGEVCNEFTGTISDVLDLDDYNPDGASGVWSSTDPNVSIDSDNVVSFGTLDIRSYAFEFTTNTAVFPCDESVYSLSVDFLDCRCPDTRLSPLDDLCIESTVIDLSQQLLTSESGNWSIESGPDINSLSLSGSMLDIDDNSEEGVYVLRYTLDDPNIPPLCDTYSEIELSLVRTPEANIIPQGEVCNEFTGTISDVLDLDDYNPDGASGVWSSTDPNVSMDSDNVVTFGTLDIRSYAFEFTTNTAVFPCDESVYTLSVDLLDCRCPDTRLSPLDDLCIESTAIDLSLQLLTSESGNWSIESGPDISSLSLSGSSLDIDDNSEEGVYVLRYTLDDANIPPLCDTYSEIDLSLVKTPEADIIPQGEVCNEFTGTISDLLDLDDYNPDGASGIWSSIDPNVSIDSDNVVTFGTLDIRSYAFEFTTNTAVLPCDDSVYSVSVDLLDCRCPDTRLSPLDDLCIESAAIDLSQQLLTSESGNWSIESGPDVNSLSLSGSMLDIDDNSDDGVYVLRYTLDDPNIPPLCDTYSEIEFRLIAEPQANIIPQGEACNEDTGTLADFIDLDDYNPDNVSGVWSTLDGDVVIDSDNSVEFISKDVRTYQFTFTTNTAVAPCVDQQYVVDIELRDCSCPVVDLSPIDALCLDNYSIDLNDLKLGTEDGDWSISDGPDVSSLELSGSQLTVDENSVAGLYTLGFELITSDIGPDCPRTASIEFLIVAPPEADIQQQYDACNIDTGAEATFIDLDDMNRSSSDGQWVSQDANIVIDGDNVVSFEGLAPGAYDFEFTTSSAVDPCQDVSYILTVNVNDCSCPLIIIDEPQDFCQEDMLYALNDLIVNAEDGSWDLIAGLGSLPVLNNDMLVITDTTSPGVYQLEYNLDDTNIPPDCETGITLEFEIFPQSEAVIIDYIELCDAYIGSLETDIDLDDLFVSGDSGTWISSDSNISIDGDNVVSFEGESPGDYEFVYRTNTAMDPCEDQEYLAVVRVIECRCPVLELEALPPLCLDGSTMLLNDYLNSELSGDWSVDAAAQMMLDIDASGVLSIDENIPEGIYDISYILNDNSIPSLCETQVTTSIEVVNPPDFELAPGQTVCNATDSGFAPVILDLDDMVSGDSGDWVSMDASVIIDNGNQINFEGLNPGVYMLEYTSNTAQDPCVDISDQLMVTVENCVCPVIAFEPPSPYCNDNVELDLSQLLQADIDPGMWSQIDGPESLNMNQDRVDIEGVASGTYRFSYTLDDQVPQGCPDSDEISIQINEALSLQVEERVEVCDQFSSIATECINLNDFVSGAAGVWEAPSNYNGDFSDVSNICFSGMQAGESFVFRYVTNSAVDPCPELSGELEVFVYDCACPVLDLEEPPAFCNNETLIDLDDFKTPETVDGSWQFVDGPQNIVINSSVITIENVMSGAYVFEYIPADTPAASCNQTNSVSIQIENYLSAGEGTYAAHCEGESIVLDLNNMLTGASAGGEWTVVSGNAIPTGHFDDVSGSLQVEDLSPGLYVFEYGISPELPCTPSVSEIEVEIFEQPVADAGPDMTLTCSQLEVLLGGENNSTGSDIEYIWTDLSSGDSFETNEPALPADLEGIYQLMVRNTQSLCYSIDEVELFNEIDDVSFEAEAQGYNCNDPGIGVIEMYNMQGGDGDYSFSINGGASWQDEPLFEGLSEGIYNIIMQDGNACEYEVSNIEIQGEVSLNVWVGDDIEIEYGDELIPLQLFTEADDDDIASIVWEQDGEIICEGTVDDCYFIDVDVFQESTICVTVTDVNGCSDSDCLNVTENVEVKVYMANVFTPQRFNNNDMFFVQTNENVVSVKTFSVWDRWGGMIFEGREEHEPNKRSEGWDGTWKDRLVQPGVYTYHVVVIDVFGESHSFAGDIMLVR